eukprot:XP_027302573.1 peroxiredoxin-like 2C [Anas platyrhynchos]
MSSPPAPPVTEQVRRAPAAPRPEAAELREASRCLVADSEGRRVPFAALYRQQKAIVVFVRLHQLCDLSTSQLHKQELESDRKEKWNGEDLLWTGICQVLGDARERQQSSAKQGRSNCLLGCRLTLLFCLVQSPHVKSSVLLGSIKSMWRAMTGPAFDFQGDPAQQGGTLILGPGNEVHFLHLDKNRMDHVPINTVLQLAGVKTVNFTNKPQIIDI